MKEFFTKLKNGLTGKAANLILEVEDVADNISKDTDKGGLREEESTSFEHQAFLTMDRIYAKMEKEDDPSRAILLTLREIMDFYQADWAGIVYLDLPIQVWTPYMWISERTGEMGWTRIQKFEHSESFERWVKMKRGTISFSRNRSPIAWRLFARLMLSRGIIVTKEKMMEAIDRDAKVTNPERNLRDHIYNLRSFFRMITDEEIIENVRGKGYRINPGVSIITDYEVFDRYIGYAREATTNFSRIQCLETAVKLFKGRFFETEYDDLSIADQARAYDTSYLQAMEDLLRALFEARDYDKVQKYAGIGLKYDPTKVAFYYWMILAQKRNKQEKEAEDMQIMAENNLDSRSLKELQIALKIQIR